MGLQRFDKGQLLGRCDTAEDHIFCHSVRDVCICLQGGGIHIEIRIGDSRLCGDFRNGDRVVAGDDLHLDALPVEELEGLVGILADLIGDNDESVGGDGAGQLSAIRDPAVASEDQHTEALPALGLDRFLVFLVVALQNKFRSTHDIGAILKGCAAVLVGRGKACDSQGSCSAWIGKVVLDGFHRDVVGLLGGGKITEQFIDLRYGTVVFIGRKGDHLVDQHGVFRDRSGLVHAKDIDTRQCLNTLHIVHEDLLHGKTADTDRQGDAGQEVESLRDHADDGSDHGGHTVIDIVLLDPVALVEEGDADGDDADAGEHNDVVQGPDHL